MNLYKVFGGTLHSDLEFSGLALASDPLPTWTLRVASRPFSPDNLEGAFDLVGEDEVNESVSVRLWRSETRYVLDYDDTGRFLVSDEGRSLTWYPPPKHEVEAAREDVLGRVIPTAMHISGLLCLHGSAVSMSGGAIGFLAPKHFGKSTTAAEMLSRGAKLVTDDTLPVGPGPPAMVRPGIVGIRLWQDSADQVASGRSFREGLGGKLVVSELPEGDVEQDPVPLAALYLLTPVEPEAEAEVTRQTLPPVPSALALVRHSKLGALLGGEEAEAQLSLAAAVAREVPVYALTVPRDFSRLVEVGDRLTEWHAGDESGDVPVS